MTENQVRHLSHVQSLDGLRGTAVILVLLRHADEILAPRGSTGITLIDHFFRGGYLGVDIFFVLSGFLITSLLLNEHEAHAKIHLIRFYGRRFLRLLPALCALLFLYSIISVLDGVAFSAIAPGILSSLFYYLNWQYVFSFPKSFGDLGYLWSLSIEEQFYIVWPALLILLLKFTKTAIVRILFIAILVTIVMWHRHVLWITPTEIPYQLVTVFVRTDARIDSLLIGCITAFVYQHRLISIEMCKFLALLGAIILIVHIELTAPYTNYMFAGGFTAVAVCVGFLILGLTNDTFVLNRIFSGRIIVLVGKTSYGIYLWHYPIFKLVARHLSTADEFLKVIVALFFTALFTTASWILIETPALRLKKRKFSTTR